MAYLPTVLEPFVLVTFNLVFISFIQNILLFLMTSPYCPGSHEANFSQEITWSCWLATKLLLTIWMSFA